MILEDIVQSIREHRAKKEEIPRRVDAALIECGWAIREIAKFYNPVYRPEIKHQYMTDDENYILDFILNAYGTTTKEVDSLLQKLAFSICKEYYEVGDIDISALKISAIRALLSFMVASGDDRAKLVSARDNHIRYQYNGSKALADYQSSGKKLADSLKEKKDLIFDELDEDEKKYLWFAEIKFMVIFSKDVYQLVGLSIYEKLIKKYGHDWL